MLKINARPLDNLLIKASGQISDQDMNLSYSEDSGGIDYTGVPFTESFSGQGTFKRKIQMGDFDLTYLLWNKAAIVGAVRYQKFEQDGTMTIDGSDESMALNFETLAFEGGLQYQFNSKLAVTLGFRYETRDLEGTETVTNETESIRSGFFGNVKWDFRQEFKLTLDYQRSYFDGPYTLISPTLFDRFRATVKGKVKEFNYSASYLLTKSKNEIPSELYESDRNQLKLRGGYSTEKFRISAGYALIDVKHTSDRIIDFPPSWSGPAGTFDWSIMYSGKSHLIDGSLSLKVGEQWSIGSYANIYSNKGFWEISRTTIKAYVEYVFTNGFATQVGYRYVNFEEKDSGFNDYTANILEVSFGYRWE
jgi:opacity protein-like surface antigen